MSTFCNENTAGGGDGAEYGRGNFILPDDYYQSPGGRTSPIGTFMGNAPAGSSGPRASFSGAIGLDEIGNRATDLADLQLGIGLGRQNDFFNLANANIATDSRIKDDSYDVAQRIGAQRRGLYDPLEASIVNEANNYDSPHRINQEMGKADAAVVQAYDKAARTGDRNQLRMGVNPNSGKAMAARENLSFDRAMASATAGNRAADNLQTKGFGMRMAAAGMGKDKVNQQLGAYGSALASGQSAISTMNRAMDSNRDVFSGVNNNFNTAAGAFGRTADINSRNSSDAARLAADKEARDRAENRQDDNMIGNLIGTGISTYFGGRSGGGGCGK